MAGGVGDRKISLAQHYARKSGQKPNFLRFFGLFSKAAPTNLLILAQNVDQTYPKHTAQSGWMPHFAEGYPEKSYGVRPQHS